MFAFWSRYETLSEVKFFYFAVVIPFVFIMKVKVKRTIVLVCSYNAC